MQYENMRPDNNACLSVGVGRSDAMKMDSIGGDIYDA